ncbi:MAG: MFS transporter [Treponemataceae bacterium]
MDTLKNTQNNRDFTILLLCDFISSFGNCFLGTAIMLFKYKEVYNLLTVSIFPMIAILAMFISYLINLKFTLKFSFRTLFFFGEVLACAFALALYFVGKNFWGIVLVYICFSIFFGLLETYRAEFLRAISSNEQIPFRQSISQGINLLVVVVGSLLAGVIADKLPLEKQGLMYLITACVYPFTAILILFISKDIFPVEQVSENQETSKAKMKGKLFRFTEASPIFIGSTVIAFVGGAASLLTMSYIFNVLQSTAIMYSILMAVSAVGSAVGSFLINVPIIKKNLKFISTLGIAGVGGIFFLILLHPTFPALIAILTISSVMSSVAMTYYAIELYIYYQQNTIRTKSALFQGVIQLAQAASKPLSALGESHFGIVPSFLVCGVGMILCSPINHIKVKKD